MAITSLTIAYASVLLITTPIVGYALAKITTDEKDLIEYYFPSLIWAFAISAAIFYTIYIPYGFISTYMALTLYMWKTYLQKKKPLKRKKHKK